MSRTNNIFTVLRNAIAGVNRRFANYYTKPEVDALAGGASAFTDLEDAPNSYGSQGGKYVRVNTGETALEFVNPPSGSGDVTGPASSTNNNIALFDGVTGKAIKDSGVALSSKADATHSHAISDVTGLQTALDGKQASGSYANATHTHPISDVTNLQTTLDGKAASSHSHAISDVTGLQTALDGKQASGSYAAASHTHAISDVTGLQTALDGKAASSHTHAISDVTGLQTELDGKAATSHTHAAGDITSGTMATARLGSGTADSTTFLRGDSTWQSVSAGATDLDGLSDVVLSDPASGKYLRHNGSEWADAEIPDGDLGTGTANNTTFLRGDRTWATPTAADGRIVALDSNVTHNNTGTYNQIFTIELDASSSHFITVNLVAETDTAGVACQVRARVTESGTTGYVLFRTPTTATAAPFDQIALGTNPSDTGETAIIAANIPIPIVAYVALKTGATPGSLVIEFQPEVAGTITIRKGSNYIKT